MELHGASSLDLAQWVVKKTIFFPYKDIEYYICEKVVFQRDNHNANWFEWFVICASFILVHITAYLFPEYKHSFTVYKSNHRKSKKKSNNLYWIALPTWRIQHHRIADNPVIQTPIQQAVNLFSQWARSHSVYLIALLKPVVVTANHFWSDSITFGSSTKMFVAPEVCYSVFLLRLCLVRHALGTKSPSSEAGVALRSLRVHVKHCTHGSRKQPPLADTPLGFFDFIRGRIWTLWMAIHADVDTPLANNTVPRIFHLCQNCQTFNKK